MANTLTELQPILFSAAQTVSAEPFGAIDAINANFDDKSVAKGDVVKVPVAPSRAAADFVPDNITATGSDATATDVEVSITKARKVAWHLTGEQQRSLDNGAMSSEWIRQLIAQGMRTLRNEAEADCVAAIYTGASYAVGTAGTNPFASALTPLADVRKLLRDNGAPMADLQFVGDTTSEANLLKLGVVLDAALLGRMRSAALVSCASNTASTCAHRRALSSTSRAQARAMTRMAVSRLVKPGSSLTAARSTPRASRRVTL